MNFNNFLQYLLQIVLCSFSASISGNTKNKPLPIEGQPVQQVSSFVAKELSPWASLINNTSDELKNIYLTNAVKINNKAEVISGNTLINAYYKKNPIHIDSIQVLTHINASPVKVYEMGKIYTRSHKSYTYLHIWDTGEQDKKIELEFIEESRPSKPVTNEINIARQEWIRLCNQHDASALINKMYTENALYYNHKPMVAGKNSITREYNYMNNGNYHLKLEPIRSEMVNEKMVFEIGQCSGNYGGKYMIVWQKTASGVWQVLMDSNI